MPKVPCLVSLTPACEVYLCSQNCPVLLYHSNKKHCVDNICGNPHFWGLAGSTAALGVINNAVPAGCFLPIVAVAYKLLAKASNNKAEC